MKKEDLIKKLGKIETPNIEIQSHKQRLKLALLTSGYFKKRTSIFWIPRLAPIALALLLVLTLSGGAVLASQESLPGEPLFSVKLFTEEVEKFLARDDFQKAEISLKLTNRRLEEVIKLVSFGNPEEDQEHINKNIERFKMELQTTENFLVKLDIKSKKNKEILKLVLKFDEDITRHQEILDQIEDLVPDQFKAAIQLAREVSAKGEAVSLKIVLKIEQESVGEKLQGEEKKSEILIRLKERAQEQISDAEEELSEAKEEVEKLGEVPNTAKELLDEAEEKLDNAKKAFDEEKYGKAFGQAKAAERLAKNAEKIKEKKEDEDEDEEEEEEPPLDTSSPVISGLSAIETTSASTMITWITNEPADSKVWFDTSTPLVIPDSIPMVSSPDLVLNHEIALFSLTPSTIYYYIAVSTDAVGNVTSSDEQTFSTLSE